MSEAIEDPVAYTKLTDHIVHRIRDTQDPNLNKVTINFIVNPVEH